MKDFEKVLKALANRRRLAIVQYLKDHKEAPVGEIAAAIRLSFRSTSRHLAVLASADVVERDQRSLQVFYRLGEPLHPAAKSIVKLV